MTEPNPTFITRLTLALKAFWRAVTEPDFAAAAAPLITGITPLGAQPAAPEPAKPKPEVLKENTPEAALQLLSLLQQEGRLVDFLQEDITAFSDADIGAAARVVHEGCNKALREHLALEPIRSEDEGARITLQAGFDAASIRLTGNVVGQPPFIGQLAHRGWRVADITLPKVAKDHNLNVLQPAEVEL